IYASVMGISGVTLPPDPIQNQPTYAAALAAFKHLPSVRILFDNGAGGSSPGQPYPGFEQSFPRFPLPGTHAKSWYLEPGGLLSASKPAKLHTNRFRWDPTATPATDYPPNLSTGAGGLWSAIPQYAWAQNPSGT